MNFLKKLLISTISISSFLFFSSTNSYSSEEQILPSEDFKKNVIFYADKLESLSKDTFLLQNKVLLIYQDFTLEADYLFLDLKNGYLKAKGNIRAINNDVKIRADELEVDISLEFVKVKKAEINLNNKIDFKAKELFVLKNYYNLEGFEFKDKDPRILLSYSLNIEKLRIFPFYNNKYFLLHLKDVNGGFLDFNNLAPIPVPGASLFIRNPTIPRKYTYQRRIRGFFDPGSFFVNAGFDAFQGPSVSATVPYFSNANSNGFLTAEYGLWSGLDTSIYQDLTDNNGNLIQFNGSYEQMNRNLKKPNLSSTLNFVHDWRYSSLNLRFGLNQTYGEMIYQRLPEVSINSIFRKVNLGELWYRYDIEATRFLLQEKNKESQDISRLKTSLFMNSPIFNISKNMNFRLLGETNFLHYFGLRNHFATGVQGDFTHDIFTNLGYTLRYRQKFVWGNSPIAFENIAPYQSLGLQLNYTINNFIELASFNEFSLKDLKFSNFDILASYKTNYYTVTLLCNFNIYNIAGINFRTNFRINDF